MSSKQTELINIKHKLNDVKELAKNNIDKILEKGEKLDLLVDTTGYLRHSSDNFYRSTRSYKRKLFYKKIKNTLIFILIFLFFIYFILILICGNLNLHNCL